MESLQRYGRRQAATAGGTSSAGGLKDDKFLEGMGPGSTPEGSQWYPGGGGGSGGSSCNTSASLLVQDYCSFL